MGGIRSTIGETNIALASLDEMKQNHEALCHNVGDLRTRLECVTSELNQSRGDNQQLQTRIGTMSTDWGRIKRLRNDYRAKIGTLQQTVTKLVKENDTQ